MAPPGIRAVMRDYAPGHVAFLRFVVASAGLAAYAAAVRMPLPALAAVGFTGVFLYLIPLLVTLVAWGAFPESLRGRRWRAWPR